MITPASVPFDVEIDFRGASGDALHVRKGVIMTDNEKYQSLSAEIRKVLSDRTNAAISGRIGLRDAVCAYVIAERARGKMLRSILRTVKEMLRRAEEAAATATDATVHRDNELAQQLVDWCTEFHRAAEPVRL
jgi:hypothetical protein